MNWKKPFSFIRSKGAFDQNIKSIVGFYPSDAFFYKQAFIHKSIANQNESEISNERLEFLGDAILSAIVTDHLFNNYKQLHEGDLSNLRSKIVSRNSLNELAENMRLSPLIKANMPLEKMSNSILGNALEALIGAVYLDLGYHKTEKFVREKMLNQINIDELLRMESNYKSRILEWGQKHKKNIRFKVLNEWGQGHRKKFTVGIFVDEELKNKASENSKKKAEQKAAQLFAATINV